jgi:tRNA(fMet)-specific endonuclease VapC
MREHVTELRYAPHRVWCPCQVFGRERGRFRAARRLIADFDLLIGATALRHDLTLLTNNRRDFEATQGLAIESQ